MKEEDNKHAVTVQWVGEQSDASREFLNSLGFASWRGEETCRLSLGATFRVFGMELPVTEVLIDIGRWTCRVESFAAGIETFLLNDTIIAVNFDARNGDARNLLTLTQLTSLNLSACESLTDLGPLSGLTRLTSLRLNHCESLTDLGPLSGLTQLTSLTLGRCRSLTNLSPLSGLKGLTRLNLSWCFSLTDLSPLAGLTQITDLYLGNCEFISDLSPLSGLTQLTRLNLCNCLSLIDLSPLSELTQLTRLNLSGCEALTELGPLSRLTQLTNLDLNACDLLADISPLSGLTRLTHLALRGCYSLADLSPLVELTQLTSLDLRGCSSFTDLIPLSRLTKLSHLYMERCGSLTDLSSLSRLTQLARLNIGNCRSLTDLSALSGLTQLIKLDLEQCFSLTDLSPLSGLTQLTKLNLHGCGTLTDLSPLSGLTQLTSLDLGLCNSITDLSPLSGLRQLTSLDLGWCKSLTELSPLSGLTQLIRLRLSECKSLTDLSPLSYLTRLTSLDLSACESLTDLKPLTGLTQLKSLNLSGSLYLLRKEKLEALSELRHIRDLPGVPPDFALQILLRAAVARDDGKACAVLLVNAPSIVEKSQDADLGITVARGCRCAGHLVERKTITDILVAALAVRAMAPEHWAEVLEELASCSWTAKILESWLDSLTPDSGLEGFIGGVLDRIAGGWFPKQVGDWLDRWLPPLLDPALAVLGPRICLAWRSLGRPDQEQAWLERLTAPSNPSFRDRVRAVYALAEIRHGRRREAAELLRQIDYDAVADPVRKALARAYAVDAPEKAGRWLEEINDAAMREELAAELAVRDDFRVVEDNLQRLLVILGTDPVHFLELLEELADRDPNNSWLLLLREELLPRHSGAGLADRVLVLLDHPAIVEVTKPRPLQQLREAIGNDPSLLDPAGVELVVRLLAARGLVDEEEAGYLLAALTVHESNSS